MMTMPERTAAHRDRIRRQYRNRRRLLDHAAHLAAMLDVRDDAYRRLLVRNAQLEADRRFAEAVKAAALAMHGDHGPIGAPMDKWLDHHRTAGLTFARTVVERLAELELDHAAEEAGR